MLKTITTFLHKLYKEYKLQKELIARFPKLVLENNVTIKGPLSNLHVNGKVLIQSNSVIHLGGMSWCQNQGSLTIGAGSCISPNVVIYACGPGGVHIGKNFDCGPGCSIFSSRTVVAKGKKRKHSFDSVTIGDDVTLFSNVVVSPGVSIGNNSVIGAGAVVINDIPPYSHAYGIPAKVKKT